MKGNNKDQSEDEQYSEDRQQKKIEGINETKCSLFEKNNKIDKPLARMNKQKGEKTQIIKTIMKEGNITSNLTDKRILRKY